MHCGLELHCLRALGRATVKTLLPRSNAVITRHWGLSHPLQIKPRTGNTQVIRGLLFCISARCQSLAVGKKGKKILILCVMDGGGRKTESQPKEPARILVDCDQCLATKKKAFTQWFACASPHIGITDHPRFSVGALAPTVQAGADNMTMFSCCKTLGPL